MNSNPSLLQRFFSDTPDFFKVLQLFGLVLVLANAVLIHYKISGTLVDDLQTVGFSIAFLSQFAVKELPKVEAAPNTVTGIVSAIPDLIDGVAQLKEALANHSTSITSAVTDVLNGIKDLSSTAAAAPATDNTVQTPAVIDTGSVAVKTT